MSNLLGRAVIGAIIAYLCAAVLTYWIVMTFSTNVHDRQMEAGMTAAFVVGPAAAVLVVLVLLLRRN